MWLSDYEDGYAINGRDVGNVTIDTLDGKERKLIFDEGIKVSMKSGGYADYHGGANPM